MNIDDKDLVIVCASAIAVCAMLILKDAEIAKLVVTGLMGVAVGRKSA